MVAVYVQNARNAGLARVLADRGHTVVEGSPGATVDIERLSGCEGLYLNPPAAADESLIRAANNLVVIGVGGAGFDHVDVDFAESRGITVVDGRGFGAVSVAEYVIGGLIASTRRLAFMQDLLRDGNFASRWTFIGNEISGKTLGIIGVGHVGAKLARLASAFDMKVLSFGRGAPLDELAALFAESDFVSVNLPLTDVTRGIVGRSVLNAAKPGLHLVNTSRGGVVDEQALADAIRTGRVAGAVIDVFASEPEPRLSPLVGMPEVICTPHCAGITHESLERLAIGVAGRMADALDAAAVDGRIRRGART
jgi:phosphoglycerate dehydrogenase-like enzyme